MKLVEDHHNYPFGDHSGVNKTASRMALSFYWPYMIDTITKVTGSCMSCQKNKITSIGNVTSPLTCCSEPLEQVHVDVVLLPSSYSFNHVITFVDRCTRYVQAYSIVTQQWPDIKKSFRRFMKEVGKPKTLISDRFSSFVCGEAVEFYAENNIVHHTSPSYRPQSNGLVERFNRTLREKLRMITQETGRYAWSRHLDNLVRIYNETPHSVTKFPPVYLMTV